MELLRKYFAVQGSTSAQNLLSSSTVTTFSGLAVFLIYQGTAAGPVDWPLVALGFAVAAVGFYTKPGPKGAPHGGQ